MRKLLLFLTLVSAGGAFGQTVKAPGNQGYYTPANTGGSFEVVKTIGGKTLHYGFTCMLSPSPVTTYFNFQLGTANPLVLNGAIFDASGKIIQTWTPGNVGYRYSHRFDASNMPAGSYHFDIFDENNNKVYSISFEKTGK